MKQVHNPSQQVETIPPSIEFLPADTRLMALVKPSGDVEPHLFRFLHKDLKVQKGREKDRFVEIVLQENLVMNLHGVTQGKLQNCRCYIPALNRETQSVNNAYTSISKAYEKERHGSGGSAFIKVYFQDKDDCWKPLNTLREQRDKTYDSEIKQKFRAAFLKLSRVDKVDILSNLLNWVVQNDGSEQILDGLKRLDIDSLQRLNTLIGISNLKNILAIWDNNQDNTDEEFWQKIFTENSFVLSQVFSLPVILFAGKVYVGGKGLSNTGGKIVDFLYTNKLTNSITLIEIKTPKTKILGNLYRDEVYSPSPEISGALVQLANYKNTLLRKFDSLVDPESKDIEVFNPACLLIAGNMQQELSDYKQG